MGRLLMIGFNPMPNTQRCTRSAPAPTGHGQHRRERRPPLEDFSCRPEAFAVASHRKAAVAQAERHLSLEIVSIGNASATVEPDGRIRADDSADGLAALKPAI